MTTRIVMPPMENTLGQAFAEAFEKHKDNQAIVFAHNGAPEAALSGAVLEKDTNQLANTFLRMGIGNCDRVILLVEKSLFTVVAHIALQKIGAYTVPLNPDFKAAELSYLVEDADPSLIIAEPHHESLLKNLRSDIETLLIDTHKPYPEVDFFRNAADMPPQVRVDPEDGGGIIYTSGTTGKPKGVVMSQKNLLHDARTVITAWEITPEDLLCHALPLYHTHGLSFALHTALLAGSQIILMDRFNPPSVIDILSEKKRGKACTLFMGVPAMYVKLMDTIGDQAIDFDHMRLWASGSAPLQPNDFWRIKKIFGKEPVEREGMTETGMNFSNPLHGKRKPGSIGLPLPGLAVLIKDPSTFEPTAVGQVGEIWLKGPGITLGYWKKPAATAETFQEGWFRTGDLGRVDEEGYYYLTDRIKDVIISGGENISPKEVELTLNALDDVVDSSVVGIPDEKWGEKLVAAIVTKPNAVVSPEKILAHCKTYLLNWKCPKDVIFVEALPRNAMGKVLKSKVQKLFR